jgi:hypothetical protein
MAYTATIRRWIGDDIDKFRCSPCGTFLNQPSKLARERPLKDEDLKVRVVGDEGSGRSP